MLRCTLLLAIGEQRGLDALLVEQHRVGLELLRAHKREGDREGGAEHGEQRDDPRVTPRLATEIGRVD